MKYKIKGSPKEIWFKKYSMFLLKEGIDFITCGLYSVCNNECNGEKENCKASLENYCGVMKLINKNNCASCYYQFTPQECDECISGEKYFNYNYFLEHQERSNKIYKLMSGV